MNSSHTSTLLRGHDSARRDSVPGRAARLLARGPATMKSPAARWAVTVLAVAGAALMVWSSVIHLQLWADGYRNISVIGPLFLIQGIGGIALAVLLAVFRRVLLIAAGAVMMAATAAGLLLSAGTGLFGFHRKPGRPLRRELPGGGVRQRSRARRRVRHRPGRPPGIPGSTALAPATGPSGPADPSPLARTACPGTAAGEFPQFMRRGPISFRPPPVCSVCG